CEIVDQGHARERRLSVELPPAPLEGALSAESSSDVYDRIAQLIEEHHTTLVFVNTRRLAERVARALSERVGDDVVTAHHGSMSKDRRFDAEQRLKAGKLKALVATASLELGIDIGDVDLVCQIGTTRTLSMFLQRVGRSGHSVDGIAKGKLFPQTRDELVESAALMDMTRRGELDTIDICLRPLDVLAQQIVAESAAREINVESLFTLVKRAYPFRDLERKTFDAVLQMLADGYSFARGRRSAYVHWDKVNQVIRARRGAGLVAMTCGGAIPDNADYDVIAEPAGTFVGTVNEDFAIESLPGNIFQLGNTSWRVLKVDSAAVRVADAEGEPPNMPFWLGEAPPRSKEMSHAVARLRSEFEHRVEEQQSRESICRWLSEDIGIGNVAAQQIYEYLYSGIRALGVMPTQDTLVMERFFDESGGMQLVIHSPFGSAINKAWGLALRKRFCRTFNFELQAAAVEDAIVISLGEVHSFDLAEVWRYLHPNSVRDVLTQAVLDAPMFGIRWRWVSTCALAIPRFRNGNKVPPRLIRMNADDLAGLVFPDQLACAENLNGRREIPDHPLVEQAITDCLNEAMDIDGLEALLTEIANGNKRLIAKDLTEPSPFSESVLNANPYAFLDDAPLEERRTAAVQSRRWLDPETASDLGALDPDAIKRVVDEVNYPPANRDEFHEVLIMHGLLRDDELVAIDGAEGWLAELEKDKRVVRMSSQDKKRQYWVASERHSELKPLFADSIDDEFHLALKQAVRSRLDCGGPVSTDMLASLLGFDYQHVEQAFIRLEQEGICLRGQFDSKIPSNQWCDRRILARIHRYTLKRLRAETKPVPAAAFMRFLCDWHYVSRETKLSGPDSLAVVVEQLAGFESAAGAWENEILPKRIRDYQASFADLLHSSGQSVWLRLNAKSSTTKGSGPLKSTPISLIPRSDLGDWLAILSLSEPETQISGAAEQVLEVLKKYGASFYSDLLSKSGLLPSQCETALGELVAAGVVTSDSFLGLRILLKPASKRNRTRGRRRTSMSTIEQAGRWDLVPRRSGLDTSILEADANEINAIVDTLLRRYGVVFKKLLERETALPPWRYLLWSLRRMEARGEVRGGRFVQGFSGEQFALPEAIDPLRRAARREANSEVIAINACDPLNLVGIILPGLRIPSLVANQVAYIDGELAGVRLGEDVKLFKKLTPGLETRVRTALVKQQPATMPSRRSARARALPKR
ncbi:MAG: Lhr family helicase, partial [Gammaproteobacteria bacterium]